MEFSPDRYRKRPRFNGGTAKLMAMKILIRVSVRVALASDQQAGTVPSTNSRLSKKTYDYCIRLDPNTGHKWKRECGLFPKFSERFKSNFCETGGRTLLRLLLNQA